MAQISFFSRVCLAMTVLAMVVCPCHAAQVLEIGNDTSQEILNILARPDPKTPEFFWRLDLAPGAVDQVENPGVTATLRFDTGLKFIFFKNVNLRGLTGISLGGKGGDQLLIKGKDKSTVINGEVKDLVPVAGDKILCELDKFHPRMPMGEVCAIVPENAPRDDNNAVITGLSFAGMSWAARLVPAKDGPVSGQSLLEHLELRRPLTPEAPLKILDFLEARGYAPWQAEFPGINMDFADMANQDPAMRKKLLREAIENFMADAGKKQADNPADTELEASIMLAPGKILPNLADADAPAADVQLFTLVIRPTAKLMLVDVAAYQGGEKD